MRLFVAVDMPAAVIEQIVALQHHLERLNLFKGRYIHKDGMHCTLKFLGDSQEEQKIRIDSLLHTMIPKSMQARLGAVDFFAQGSFIKIIYVHLVCPELALLTQSLDSLLEPVCARETRPFIAHITVARVKQVSDHAALLDALNRSSVESITWVIDRFVLKKSVLTPDGPVYTTIQEYLMR